MLNALIGTKMRQTQYFTQEGRRVPATLMQMGPCWVVQIKKNTTDGYWAVQLGFGTQKEKRVAKPQQQHIKQAGLPNMPRFLREIRVTPEQIDAIQKGTSLTVDQVFSTGDKVSVTGISKGKGFAGGMKRHGFAGGPASHGQSDRSRAPGSIGGTTTPGRVYKGKRMAGRMGGETITVKGLSVLEVNKEHNQLLVSGLVPGASQSLLTIKKLSSNPTKVDGQ